MAVKANWQRIRAWYKANTPSGTFDVAPRATKQELAEFEALIGVSMPLAFRESYLLHDGTKETWLVYHGILRSLSGISKEWSEYLKGQKQKGFGKGPEWEPAQLASLLIKPIWWSPLRIPLTDNGGGDPVTIDLDPASGGTVGQILSYHHEVGPINVLASGFGEWLELIASELEAGKYVFDEDEGMARPAAWDE